jgi:hypothetical protein
MLMLAGSVTYVNNPVFLALILSWFLVFLHLYWEKSVITRIEKSSEILHLQLGIRQLIYYCLRR